MTSETLGQLSNVDYSQTGLDGSPAQESLCRPSSWELKSGEVIRQMNSEHSPAR